MKQESFLYCLIHPGKRFWGCVTDGEAGGLILSDTWKPPVPLSFPSRGCSQPKTRWKVCVAEKLAIPHAHHVSKIKFRGITIPRTYFWLLSNVKPTPTVCCAVSRCGWIYLIFNE